MQPWSSEQPPEADDKTVPPPPPIEELTDDAAPAELAPLPESASITAEPGLLIELPELIAPELSAATVSSTPFPAVEWENRLVANLRSPQARLRLSTIRLIARSAQAGHSFRNEQPDVNGDTTWNTLQQLGYGVNEQGEPLEPVPVIRQSAIDAVKLMEAAESPTH